MLVQTFRKLEIRILQISFSENAKFKWEKWNEGNSNRQTAEITSNQRDFNKISIKTHSSGVYVLVDQVRSTTTFTLVSTIYKKDGVSLWFTQLISVLNIRFYPISQKDLLFIPTFVEAFNSFFRKILSVKKTLSNYLGRIKNFLDRQTENFRVLLVASVSISTVRGLGTGGGGS